MVQVLPMRYDSFSQRKVQAPDASPTSLHSYRRTLHFQVRRLAVHTASHAVDFPSYTPQVQPVPSPLTASPDNLCPCLSPSPSDLKFSADAPPSSMQSQPAHLYTKAPVPNTPDRTLSSSPTRAFSLHALSSSWQVLIPVHVLFHSQYNPDTSPYIYLSYFLSFSIKSFPESS